MIQRSFPRADLRGLHVAIIMDGNGRWAAARGLPRPEGHRAGAEAVRATVEAARRRGLGTLTLYAFSSDNWRRPRSEVRTLMRLFRQTLVAEAERCARHGIGVSVVGRRDRLEPSLVGAIESVEALTRDAADLQLRIAIDYSARDAIVAAAGSLRGKRPPTREGFARALARAMHLEDPSPPVDLLIRTGGERRLSDFLLWECAYAELLFLDCPWPEFGTDQLEDALREFTGRERRFGGLPSAPAGGRLSFLRHADPRP